MRAAAELNAVDAVRGRPGARVHLSCSLEEEQTALTVADNGPGLPAGDPEEVFVPFFTTKQGGSGIGLTLARQIALAHGGRLEHRRAARGRIPAVVADGIAANPISTKG
jgi:C4-dicarboxylate-specific signal transduction histidine kinase